MAQTQAILRSLHMLTKKRRSLKAMERRLAEGERKVMDGLSRVLSDSGYRVVAVNGQSTKVVGATGRRRRLSRQNLKCPKCGRRFSFTMHLARHINAMHTRKKRSVGKAAA